MPRPNDHLALIRFPHGVHDFTAALGIHTWWDHLEQAAVFIIDGYSNAAVSLGGLQKTRDLHGHLQPAVNSIRSTRGNWRAALATGDWNKCNSLQSRRAISQKPILLVKAVTLIVALEGLISERTDISASQISANIDQLYNDVRIVPAFYKLDGFDEKTYVALSDAVKSDCAHAINALGVARGANILTEMASGHHATHDVAAAVQTELAKHKLPFAIVTARRANGGKGNVKPACKSFAL